MQSDQPICKVHCWSGGREMIMQSGSYRLEAPRWDSLIRKGVTQEQSHHLPFACLSWKTLDAPFPSNFCDRKSLSC